MPEDDAFDAAYGGLASARFATGLRRSAPDTSPVRDKPAATAKGSLPRSLLLTRLDVMRPKVQGVRRNWRFTD